MQMQIDISRKQNSKENQEIFEESKTRLTKQCAIVWGVMCQGKVLTTAQASAGVWYQGEKYIIGDLRARVRDLITHGLPVQKRIIKGGFKEYFKGE